MKRFIGIVALVALVITGCQPITAQPMPRATTGDVQLANAMSAAPIAVAKHATILGYDTDGMPTVVLRAGDNGWTCIVDAPVSPGNDPICLDATFAAWNEALMANEDPQIKDVGIAYMLAGGSDPSNTDPFAAEPAAGADWITTPPHIMILAPGGFDGADFATEPKQDEPYIMWEGTPYEHLMVPVVPTAKEAMGDVDAVMQNTLSSAPAGIALHATIKGYPEKEGDPLVVLKEGTNGWVCNPDRTVSPGNDPSCNNAHMEAAFSGTGMEGVMAPAISYMLQGGSDESNFDITATGPAPGEDWVTTAPHIMLMVPNGFNSARFTTDYTSGFPYIMFDSTPYEHLMIPVAQESGANSVADVAGVWRIMHPQSGEFRLAIDTDGVFRAQSMDQTPALYDTGKIVVDQNQVRLESTGEGHALCTSAFERTGRYTVTVTKVAEQTTRLTFNLVEDACLARQESVLFRPLERVAE